MKMKHGILVICILFLSPGIGLSQTEDNEAIQVSGRALLSNAESREIFNALESNKKQNIFDELNDLVALSQNDFTDSVGDFYQSMVRLRGHLDDVDDGNKNTAVIVIYRKLFPLTDGNGVQIGYNVDFEVSNSVILRKDWAREGFQNYLLNTKNVVIVYIDVADVFYEANTERERLYTYRVKIDYKDSFFKKSFNDLLSTTAGLGIMGTEQANDVRLNIAIVKLSPRRINAPCVIELSNNTFKESMKFDVHENNVASFQVGLVNTKFDKKNFEITGGNLIVKADSAEKAAWKSNLYALVELHLPRDIDNYEPIWKAATMKYGASRRLKVWNRLYKITLDRIGVYGGAKISKDPLSNIYYGFNYAITKELAVNFGWTLTNEVVPQVTTVGSISSIPDALEYAKREYSAPIFSWGLSFSPGALSKTLGLGKDE